MDLHARSNQRLIGAAVDSSAMILSRTRHGNLARGVSEGELPIHNAITNGLPRRIVVHRHADRGSRSMPLPTGPLTYAAGYAEMVLRTPICRPARLTGSCGCAIIRGVL